MAQDDLRLGRGWLQGGVDFAALEELVMLEHAEDGVEEFTHGGDEGLHFGFAAGQEVFHAHVHVIPRFFGDGLHLFPQGSYKAGDMEKTAEELRQRLMGNANPVVLDLERDSSALPLRRPEADACRGGGVAQGVVDQDRQQLDEVLAVGAEGGRQGGVFDGQLDLLDRRDGTADSISQSLLSQIKRLAFSA